MANIEYRKQTAKQLKKHPPLDTLELTAENGVNTGSNNSASLSKTTLTKSVSRKSFQNHYIPYLAQLAEQEKNEYWRKRSWKVFHCADSLSISEGEYRRKRCKLSECLICQGYKTNQRVKTHLPILQQLKDLHFVTLTVPNVLVCDLRQTIRLMSDTHRSIRDRLRKQGYKARGAKNLEVTFNPDRSDFHPHFHCIVETKEIAKLFVKYWVEAWEKKSVWLSKEAQDCRPFGSKESDLLEAFKYANKIITTNKQDARKIHSWGLYESIKATSGGKGGIRTFQTFGFTRSQFKTEKESATMKVDTSLPEGSYSFVFDKDASFFDYVDLGSGISLTDYQMPKGLSILLNENIV
jgi:hypothetical protein